MSSAVQNTLLNGSFFHPRVRNPPPHPPILFSLPVLCLFCSTNRIPALFTEFHNQRTSISQRLKAVRTKV